jgi:hypothetical protein
VTVDTGGQTWDLAGQRALPWQRTSDGLRAALAEMTWLAVAPRPVGAPAAWPALVEEQSRRPLRATRARVAVGWRRGVVRQTLHWVRSGRGAGVTALLPHQRLALAGSPPVLAGSYKTSRGSLSLVRSDVVRLAIPLRGFLAGVPAARFSAPERAAVARNLASDLSARTDTSGGSYFGPKALWRLAGLVEVARRVGDRRSATAALAPLRAGLEDWLRYSGPGDRRWLAYEPTWGGVVARPPEFGNEDYNDHHFHYGYLIGAAAVVAGADAGFRRRDGPAVDALVGDVLGAHRRDLPRFRVFNPYEGHSYASGFAPTPDGNNQESSSEAVNAWWAIARWGLVTGRRALVEAAVARYAIEALAARTYWLGEVGGPRPAGYAHRVAGIVWGGKIDFATFFDRRAEAVVGIQLLPFTFGSLYRVNPASARARVAAVRRAAGSAPRLWPDLFLMDLALDNPSAALRQLGARLPIEKGNSRAFTRYWITALRRLGPPRADVHAGGPYGMAFARGYVGLNPTRRDVTVVFRDNQGRSLRRLRVPSRSAALAGR